MSKSKLTLLVDGNWLLMSRLSVFGSRYLEDNELCNELQLLMVRSIGVVLKQFPEIDSVIVCADGGSWRTKVDIPSCLHHEEKGTDAEYKGTRVRSDDINWDMIFTSYEELLSLFEQYGITACREKDIEGDDWIYHWSKYLNENNTNVIIWSKDNDLKQLVKMNNDKCFTFWWNKDSGFITPKYEDDNISFMFNMSYNENEDIINNLQKHCPKFTQINPKEIIIDKILKGDSSDNILPVILRNSKSSNSDRKFKISSKDIDYDLDWNNKEEVTNFITNIANSKNYAGRCIDTIPDMIEHFDYNRQLIVLEDKSYPESIKEIFNEHKEYFISKDISQLESYLIASSNKIRGILDII